MTTLRECADTAAAALAEMLRAGKGDVDREAVAAVIEGVLNEAASEREEGAERRLVDLEASMQKRLTRLLEASPAVIYSFKARDDFAPVFVSDNIETLFGYAPRDYLDDPNFWRDHVHAEDLARVEAEIGNIFTSGKHTLEYRFRRKDGSYCWVSDELQVLRNLSGDPVEVVGAWSDITARKQLGEALVAAQERLVHLLSCAPAVIYSYRATGDFAPTFVSQNITDWLGYDPQEYLENPDFWRVRVHPDELARVEAESVQLFKKGRHTVEYRFLKKDGTYCWVIDEQHLIRNRDGEPVEWSARGATSPRQRRRRSPSAAASSA
jgi:PAS domain S-box-containing protein